MRGSLPRYSRAAVVRDFKAPVCIEEVPVPQEVEPGAIVTKLHACSICGTDVHLWQGDLIIPVNLPVVLGHEMVGEIVAMGSGADRDSIGQDLKVGDRITWTHTSCGRCYFCTVLREPTLCQYSKKYMYVSMEEFPHLLGGFSEYGYVMPEAGRVRVPDNVPGELASMASCAFRSVMQAFDILGRVDPNDTVVVQGAGPLGLLATAVAKVSGARKVVTIGAPDARLAIASEFGADEVISVETTSAAERVDRVLALTNGRGADTVMEFTGHPAAFVEGTDLARRGGSYVVVGQLGQGEVSIKPSVVVAKQLRILGSFSGQAKAYWKALEFVSLHGKHIPFERMISGRYKLDEVNTALGRMKKLEEIKPVIMF
jgi:D-arabinose 1-dehydrogenase-like Zn-dependent alcohol dehydrogenase